MASGAIQKYNLQTVGIAKMSEDRIKQDSTTKPTELHIIVSSKTQEKEKFACVKKHKFRKEKNPKDTEPP